MFSDIWVFIFCISLQKYFNVQIQPILMILRTCFLLQLEYTV